VIATGGILGRKVLIKAGELEERPDHTEEETAKP
jgi:hypothetical protein